MPVPTSPDIASEARLSALDQYDILDTSAEGAFNDIVSLAKHLCDTPVALVSLVTASRQWFKAKVGTELCETPISQSVCAHVVAQRVALVIPDLTLDERTRDNTLVTMEPHIRFYAGVPLIDGDGHALGSLCVIDIAPRPHGLTAEQEDGLHALGRQVISQLELRRALHDLQTQQARMLVGMKRQTALVDLGNEMRAIDTRSPTARQEAIDAALRTIGETVNVSRCGYAMIDVAADSIMIAGEWIATGQKNIKGEYALSAFPAAYEYIRNGAAITVDDLSRDAAFVDDIESYRSIGVKALILVPFLQDRQLASVLFVHSDSVRAWGGFEVSFVRAIADRLHSFVSRRAAEDFQRLLDEELSHRMKNMLTLVQSIAMQTLGKFVALDAFEAFSQRIIALGKAHDVLLQHSWAAARIHSTMESVLGLHRAMSSFAFNGPDVNLAPQAVLTMSLLLHELATNAAKYGSLSVPDGRVEIDWSVKHGTAPTFHLTWREIGGPAVQTPVRRGFGSRLIKMGLSGSGKVITDYQPEGLVANFTAPLASVTSS